MGKIHLCRQNSGKLENWFILEEDVDYIGAMSNGLVSIVYTKDMVQAVSVTELLHKLQENDEQFSYYAVLGYLDSKNRTREKEYPLHREIHLLAGFVPQVCNFEIERNNYDCEWKVRYVSELWVRIGNYVMVKVSGFNEAMMRARDKFIRSQGLEFEEATE